MSEEQKILNSNLGGNTGNTDDKHVHETFTRGGKNPPRQTWDDANMGESEKGEKKQE